MSTAVYNTRRRRLIAYGRWRPWVDAAPVRDHVRAQMTAGLGWQRIAGLAGVSTSTVSNLIYVKAGRSLTTRMRPTTAARLLAVRADLDTLAPHALIDATGTRRRIQGLIWLGYTERRISTMLSPDRAQRLANDVLYAQRVTAATALAVRALSEQLEGKPAPAQTKGARIWVARSRASARREGWVPLAAWDAIDDPAAVPDLGPATRATRNDRVTEVERLLGMGESLHMACKAVGITPETLRSSRWRGAQSAEVAA